MAALSHSGSQKRLNTTLSGLNSVETMQKSVLNAFALKFSTLLPSTLDNRQISCCVSSDCRVSWVRIPSMAALLFSLE